MTRLTTLLLTLLLACQASAATLVARVDRTQLSLDETVELTLETSDTTVFGKPDLQPLEGLFRVLGLVRRTSSPAPTVRHKPLPSG